MRVATTRQKHRLARLWKWIRASLSRTTISGKLFQFKGKLNEAIAEFQKAVELNNDPFSLAMLGQAYARQGKTDEARKILARLREQAKSQYVSALCFGGCADSR